MQDLVRLVHQATRRLDNWLVRNGWAGYDPYDLRGLPGFINPPNLVARTVRRITLKAERWFPWILRQLFRVPKTINAKGMGLFAEGYRQLFEATGDEQHLQRARQALEWLEVHSRRNYSGYCWGYPFDWQSRLLIPKGTPSSVVSATVGQAFWGFYRMTGEDRYLDICDGICQFFMNDLHKDRFDDKRICFSYTPVDTFHVHNANLFVADFLVRVGLAVGKANYVEYGMQAVAYALSEQNDDGSICYWGRDQSSVCHIDHYHSGFEIRSLYEIWKSTEDTEVYEALKLYYTFYKEQLFEGKTIPKKRPTSLYPIDIHSCAESILCHSTLAPDFPEAWQYLQNCVPWVLQNMQHPDGWFIYLLENIKGQVRRKIKIPYIRWGQAWMLRALAAYLKAMKSESR